MKKLPLSAALLAAIQSGANVDAPDATTEAAPAAPAADAAVGAEEVETPAAPPAAAVTDAPAAPAAETPTPAPEAAAAPAAPAAPAAQDNALVAYLRDEVKELKAQLATANESIAKLTGDNTTLKTAATSAATDRMTTIVRTATQRLAIALGATPVGIENLSGAALADQFEALDGQFAQRFKVGAASNASADAAPAASGSVKAFPGKRRTNATKL